MKTIITALALAVATPAAAQQFFLSPFVPMNEPLPKTVTLTAKGSGKVIGTATFNGNHIYYRDANNKHIATAEIGPDGQPTYYDHSGNVITAESGEQLLSK